MNKFALLAIATFVLLMITDTSQGQLFRRRRDRALKPASAQQAARSAQQKYRGTAKSEATKPSQSPQKMTPYARLTPEQRAAALEQADKVAKDKDEPAKVPTSYANKKQKPTLAAPKPATAANGQVRIVTYIDPRTGRRYQRKIIVPAKPADKSVPSPAVATSATQLTSPTLSQSVSSAVEEDWVPVLAAPGATVPMQQQASPIASTVDNNLGSVTTASAEMAVEAEVDPASVTSEKIFSVLED